MGTERAFGKKITRISAQGVVRSSRGSGRGTTRDGEPLTLENFLPILIEFLIHEGHDLTTMMGMSVKQLVAFSKLAADRNMLDVASRASVVRIAYHADKKQYMKFLDELNEDG